MKTQTGVLNWHITPEDDAALEAVLNRAARDFTANGWEFDRLHHAMDLLATHANGCPLDFAAMAEGRLADLAHDLGGIRKHLDRETGKLGGFFLPRFAKRGG